VFLGVFRCASIISVSPDDPSSLASTNMTLPTTPQKPNCVQPGGGFCIGIELAWGRLRRWLLRTLRPGYVKAMQEKRKGDLAGCPIDVIDDRDLKFYRNVCTAHFAPEDDRFRWRDRLGFARYGFAEIILFTLAFLALGGLCTTAALTIHWVFWIPYAGLFLVWLEILYFFRDPERAIPTDTDALASPADGVVTNIEEVADADFPGGKALRVSIFLSIFNVHVNRMPRAAKITDVRYFPGAYLDARNPDSAVRNEQLWIDATDTATGQPMRVKQISGAIARRIVCWLKPGDELARGERLGMIKLGSRTDLLLPVESVKEVCVKVGTKVLGGSTILLRLK
jgi:phosphatidylserine decarboxylase